MTPRMRQVLAKVRARTKDGSWYRAESKGERVTLVYLERRAKLVRRCWRGEEGDPNAAHEYRPKP